MQIAPSIYPKLQPTLRREWGRLPQKHSPAPLPQPKLSQKAVRMLHGIQMWET